MDILFIGKRFYTNRDALKERFGRIYQLPWYWAETGKNVDLWLIDYHLNEKETFHDRNLKGESTPIFSLGFAKRALNTLIKGKPEHIVASGDCYIGMLGYLLAKLSGAEFTFDLYDKYDEFPGYRSLPFFDPLLFLQKRSTTLLFASKALLETVVHPRKVLIPNGIDPSLFFPREIHRCREEFGLPATTTIVGYFGSMEPERGIDDLLATVRTLRASDKNIELILGGKKPETLNLLQDGVRYLGNIHFTKMPEALCCCNVLVLPYRHSAFLDMASSCKIAEYIAVRIPIVTTRTPNILSNFPEQAKALKRSMAPPNDAKALAKGIMLQLKEKIVVEQPECMTWKSIAERALAQILRK